MIVMVCLFVCVCLWWKRERGSGKMALLAWKMLPFLTIGFKAVKLIMLFQNTHTHTGIHEHKMEHLQHRARANKFILLHEKLKKK